MDGFLVIRCALSYEQVMRIISATVLLVVAAACGGSTLPLVAEVPEVPERPDGTRPPSTKELQKEIRVAHHDCTQRRQALQSDVDAAESGDIALISAATVLMVLGEAVDGSSLEVLSQPTTDRVEAVPPVQPSKRLATETRAVAEERVREINTSLDGIQSFLSANPDPDDWTEADNTTWTERMTTLRGLCR